MANQPPFRPYCVRYSPTAQRLALRGTVINAPVPFPSPAGSDILLTDQQDSRPICFVVRNDLIRARQVKTSMPQELSRVRVLCFTSQATIEQQIFMDEAGIELWSDGGDARFIAQILDLIPSMNPQRVRPEMENVDAHMYHALKAVAPHSDVRSLLSQCNTFTGIAKLSKPEVVQIAKDDTVFDFFAQTI